MIRTIHPLFLPLLCCWAWMSQTGLRLNWAEEFSTSGLYLQLTVIWMELIVSSRSTKTELFWVWALSALHSEGVVLWRLTATAGPVCQNFMWHKTELSPAWELQGIGVVTTLLEGFGWNVRACILGVNHHINCMKNRLWWKIPFFTAFRHISWGKGNHYTQLFEGLRDDKHLPQSAKPHSGASPPPPRSHTTLQVW